MKQCCGMYRKQEGYIIERVAASKKEKICFDGVIQLCSGTLGLCPPIRLCGIRIISVNPLNAMTDCGAPKGTRLKMTLECTLEDRNGHSGCAYAEIVVAARDCPMEYEHMGPVYRGVKVDLKSAYCCSHQAFHVYMDLIIHTIIGQKELIWHNQERNEPVCQPALYPQPRRLSAF